MTPRDQRSARRSAVHEYTEDWQVGQTAFVHPPPPVQVDILEDLGDEVRVKETGGHYESVIPEQRLRHTG